MINSLIPKDQFIGLKSVAHLATGGESPMLKTHIEALQQFAMSKSKGEEARALQSEVQYSTRLKCAQLFSVQPEEITFLPSSSDGINVLRYALDWQAGDNVVVADVEFPSDVLPWTTLADQGVELRIVKHKNWHISIEDIAAQIDDRTRIVAMSHVSMFTGQRMDYKALSKVVRASNALFLLDASHSAGVVPVEAQYADVMVASCYKWLLGVHGTAVFYWNRSRLPDLMPPFLGWNSTTLHPSWETPTTFKVRDSANRFLAGNPSFISLYILNNALDTLLALGDSTIEAHALALSGKVWQGVNALGWEMMTPELAKGRAGNVCFMASDINGLTKALEAHNVLIWGAYQGVGRVRISTHLYNDEDDVNRCLAALRAVGS